MTPERFRRIRVVYEAALEIEESRRESFLKEHCQNDSDLRGEVEQLLKAHGRASDWFGGPLLGLAERFLASADRTLRIEGRRLGGYQIVREIGRGGMGSVYLAERVDGVARKQVAIKVVRPGMDDPDLLDRFRQEREIFGSLDHPAIARLIDGGSTEEGLPYLVMDYVQGQPIDRWCDQHKLNVTERLKLFRGVCTAVQYAHQNLVVHRDLKPANILVTADGAVRLLDFGIAKLLEPQSLEGLQPTVTMLRIMTPEYASPEQVKGEAITTLTDIYSLGVVLYELLTGHWPYRPRNGAPHEIARAIWEEDPVPPSAVVSTTEDKFVGASGRTHQVTPEGVSELREGAPNRLQRRLEGDLDSILLKALRKEPSGRYSSVEQLSEDLRRHLEGMPVIARKDTIRYRLGKFIHRYPAAAAAAALLFFALFTGLMATMWEARIALQEQREVEVLLERALQACGPGAHDDERNRLERRHRSHARTILTPEIIVFNYAMVVAFAIAIYLTGAPIKRIGGLWRAVLCLHLYCSANMLSLIRRDGGIAHSPASPTLYR